MSASPQSSDRRAEKLVDAALWLQRNGEFAGARRLLEEALSLDPANARAQEILSTTDPERARTLLHVELPTPAPTASPDPSKKDTEPELPPVAATPLELPALGSVELPPTGPRTLVLPLPVVALGGEGAQTLEVPTLASPPPSEPSGGSLTLLVPQPQTETAVGPNGYATTVELSAVSSEGSPPVDAKRRQEDALSAASAVAPAADDPAGSERSRPTTVEQWASASESGAAAPTTSATADRASSPLDGHLAPERTRPTTVEQWAAFGSGGDPEAVSSADGPPAMEGPAGRSWQEGSDTLEELPAALPALDPAVAASVRWGFVVLAGPGEGLRFSLAWAASPAGLRAGQLVAPGDPSLEAYRAIFFLRHGRLYVRDDSTAGGGVFVSVPGMSPLSTGRVFRAGHRRFRYLGLLERSDVAARAIYGLEEVLPDGRRGPITSSHGPLFTIGRVGCDWSFPDDEELDSPHLTLSFDPRVAVLRDLSATARTYLRVEAASPPSLRAKDRVWVGELLLEIDELSPAS